MGAHRRCLEELRKRADSDVSGWKVAECPPFGLRATRKDDERRADEGETPAHGSVELKAEVGE